jgi:hypothetical protein
MKYRFHPVKRCLRQPIAHVRCPTFLLRPTSVADRFHAIRLVGPHVLKVARQFCPALGWNCS